MRASVVLAFFAFVFTFVGAAIPTLGGANARRMAQGLAPLPPVRRSPTPAGLVARSQPSGVSQCNSGPVQCCNSVQKSQSGPASVLLALLNVVVPLGTDIGLSCSPLGLGALGGNTCNSQSVCCQNNSFNGLVAIGCTPINVSL